MSYLVCELCVTQCPVYKGNGYLVCLQENGMSFNPDCAID